MMLVVNLFAGPGTGKSTVAAGLFHHLKMAGVNCELVTEYAKDLTWERNHCQLGNQLRILAEQHHRLHRLREQVDVVVTDAPLLISNIYRDPWLPPPFNDLVLGLHFQFANLNVLLHRTGQYNPVGRSQTEAEANGLDVRIRRMLDECQVDYHSQWCTPMVVDRLEAMVRGTICPGRRV